MTGVEAPEEAPHTGLVIVATRPLRAPIGAHRPRPKPSTDVEEEYERREDPEPSQPASIQTKYGYTASSR